MQYTKNLVLIEYASIDLYYHNFYLLGTGRHTQRLLCSKIHVHTYLIKIFVLQNVIMGAVVIISMYRTIWAVKATNGIVYVSVLPLLKSHFLFRITNRIRKLFYDQSLFRSYSHLFNVLCKFGNEVHALYLLG